MTFTPASQTAHNVPVRKIPRAQPVAPASRRLSRGHPAHAAHRGKPAICFTKSLFLKILPVSPTGSRFCRPNSRPVASKSFGSKILQNLIRQNLFRHPPRSTTTRASGYALKSSDFAFFPVPQQTGRPTPQDGCHRPLVYNLRSTP